MIHGEKLENILKFSNVLFVNDRQGLGLNSCTPKIFYSFYCKVKTSFSIPERFVRFFQAIDTYGDSIKSGLGNFYSQVFGYKRSVRCNPAAETKLMRISDNFNQIRMQKRFSTCKTYPKSRKVLLLERQLLPQCKQFKLQLSVNSKKRNLSFGCSLR